MSQQSVTFDEMEYLLQELVEFHQEKLLKCGKRIIPHLTTDDILQPNDFPVLENHPFFRYEEGMLAGVQTVQMAFWAMKKTKLDQ